MIKQKDTFDYIIGGGGLAGLTLAWQMLEAGLLKDKKLLIIEPGSKTKNDRTWCFWSKNEPWLSKLPISKEWQKAEIRTADFSLSQSIAPFKYYKIEGLDFYQFVLKQIRTAQNISWITDEITGEDADSRTVFARSQAFTFSAYFFKGCFYSEELPALNSSKKHFIWQHFLGWKIQTEEKLFQPDQITYMDMRVPEVTNGLSFAYILPDAANKALVEFTLFSAELWQKADYELALKAYIKDTLQISKFEIIEQEYNRIPMTNAVFLKRKGNIIPIGTLAGTVKPSTGYSFVRNYRHIQKIVKNLQTGKDDFSVETSTRFKFYDEVLINVLKTGKSSGHEVFTALYKQNSLPLLFRFLNEETSIWQDLKIMNSVPKKAFIKAVKEELLK